MPVLEISFTEEKKHLKSQIKNNAAKLSVHLIAESRNKLTFFSAQSQIDKLAAECEALGLEAKKRSLSTNEKRLYGIAIAISLVVLGAFIFTGNQTSSKGSPGNSLPQGCEAATRDMRAKVATMDANPNSQQAERDAQSATLNWKIQCNR